MIGVSDERWGEVGHLVMVTSRNDSIHPDEVIAYLLPRLARYKIPKAVSFVAALPRNGAGKILKASLRAMLSGDDGSI